MVASLHCLERLVDVLDDLGLIGDTGVELEQLAAGLRHIIGVTRLKTGLPREVIFFLYNEKKSDNFSNSQTSNESFLEHEVISKRVVKFFSLLF